MEGTTAIWDFIHHCDIDHYVRKILKSLSLPPQQFSLFFFIFKATSLILEPLC